MAKDLEDERLLLDVLHERLGHGNRDLERRGEIGAGKSSGKTIYNWYIEHVLLHFARGRSLAAPPALRCS